MLSLLCFLFALNSCGGSSDKEAYEPEEVRVLVDKKDSIFWDNGKYFAATTEFTDSEAVSVLKGSIWKDDGYPYVYDYTKIKKVYGGFRDVMLYSFYNGGIYKSKYIDDADAWEKYPEFEYSVKNKILELHLIYRFAMGEILSEYTLHYTLVSVDKDRIVMDGKYNKNMYVPQGLPNFDPAKTTTRYVWTSYNSETE